MSVENYSPWAPLLLHMLRIAPSKSESLPILFLEAESTYRCQTTKLVTEPTYRWQ